MSRIGKRPVGIPAGVTVKLEGDTLIASGPKGEVRQRLPAEIKLNIDMQARRITFERSGNAPRLRASHGLCRALVSNMMIGVTKGFEKRLEVVGVGYRAEVKGRQLVMQLGYTHPVIMEPPPGVFVTTPSPTLIVVSGCDKQQVGQFAAEIKSKKMPDPYKHKGIRYQGEVLRKKAGKTFVSGD